MLLVLLCLSFLLRSIMYLVYCSIAYIYGYLFSQFGLVFMCRYFHSCEFVAVIQSRHNKV